MSVDLLTNLPLDLLEQVLGSDSGISCKEIARVCTVNKAFQNLCNSETYWERQCRRLRYDHFDGYLLIGDLGPPPGGGTWREYYKWRCLNCPVEGNVLSSINSAFCKACEQGFFPIVLALIAAGANVNAATNYGSTALIVAANRGHFAIVQALLAAPGIHVNDALMNSGSAALTLAASNGHVAIVQALLAAGANVNSTGNNGWTALILAAVDGHLFVVRALIAAGANVNAALLMSGNTALSHAASSGRVDIVEALLAAPGIHINATLVDDGWTALVLAAIGGHVAVVQALLAMPGIDVNAADNYGRTALSLAGSVGKATEPSLVQALCDAGAVEKRPV